MRMKLLMAAAVLALAIPVAHADDDGEAVNINDMMGKSTGKPTSKLARAGYVVMDAKPGGAWSGFGLQRGDVVHTFDGCKTETAKEIAALKGRMTDTGAAHVIEFERGGKEYVARTSAKGSPPKVTEASADPGPKATCDTK